MIAACTSAATSASVRPAAACSLNASSPSFAISFVTRSRSRSCSVFAALIVNGYGQFDELIRVLAPAMGQAGLEHLKQRMIDLSNRPVTKPAEKDRVKIGI